jgi:hypothetical protein
VYARDVADKRLTFGVSGKLWNRSLIMYDRETNSDWSHILGKSMAGPLAGTELKQVPSVMTDWASWSKQHPAGTVIWMQPTSVEYKREFYRHPADFVLGIVDHGSAVAWGFDEIVRRNVIQDQLGDSMVVVLYDAASVTARLYSRELDGQSLTFTVDDENHPIDNETGTQWDPITGRGIRGKLAGKHLQALPAIVSYRKAWTKFHPDSRFGE